MSMRRTFARARTAALVIAAALTAAGQPASGQVFYNNVEIQGSLCVGLDCQPGQTYGFDTIIMKENNLRMLFLDTSTASGFPSNNWRLIANDSASGGASYFAIEDATAARQVFRVDAGAPANSLLVGPTGQVGFGTATPSSTCTSPTPTLLPCGWSRMRAPASRHRPGISPATTPTSSFAT